MFNELLALGHRLIEDGYLPPPGYYKYSVNEPIKWVIHYNQDEPEKSEIRQTEIKDLARPFSGRTGNVQAYPIADEAAYVFGIDSGRGRGKKNEVKQKAFVEKKHRAYIALLDEISESLRHTDLALSETVTNIKQFISDKKLSNSGYWSEIESKDWVSIQIEGKTPTVNS